MNSVHCKTIKFLLVFLFSFIATAESHNLILEKDGDILTGVHNIKINEQFYSVSFVEGLAENIFKTPGSSWNFMFNDQESAQTASNELLEQVFIHDDPDLQYYDYYPTWTHGIPESAGMDAIANIITPFYVVGPDLHYISAVNLNGTQDDYYSDLRIYGHAEMDTAIMSSDNHEYVWAVWTQGAAPVPVPGTLSLLGLGILSIAGISRKKMNP